MKIKTEFNAVPSKGEDFTKVKSLTIPGQALSLRMQLAKGIQAGQFMVRPIHFTDSEIPLPPMDDLTDIANAIDYNRVMGEKLKEWEKQNEEARRAKEDEKYRIEMDKRFAEYLKSQAEVNKGKDKPE